MRSQAVSMWFDLELQICIFRSQKMKAYAYAFRIRKFRPDFFRFGNPTAQVDRFWPKLRRPRPSVFQIEKWYGLLIQKLSTIASSSKTIDKR